MVLVDARVRGDRIRLVQVVDKLPVNAIVGGVVSPGPTSPPAPPPHSAR